MLRFYIPNMTCGSCAESVTKALLSEETTVGYKANGSAALTGPPLFRITACLGTRPR